MEKSRFLSIKCQKSFTFDSKQMCLLNYCHSFSTVMQFRKLKWWWFLRERRVLVIIMCFKTQEDSSGHALLSLNLSLLDNNWGIVTDFWLTYLAGHSGLEHYKKMLKSVVWRICLRDMQKSRYSLPSYLEKPLDRVWIWSIRWQWPSLECLFSLNKKAKKPNIIEGRKA